MNNTIEIRMTVLERQVWPTTYYKDDDNPTPEEEKAAEQAIADWEARGGADLRTLRVEAHAGASSGFLSRDMTGIQGRAVESDPYLVGDDAARKACRDEVVRAMSESIIKFLDEQ